MVEILIAAVPLLALLVSLLAGCYPGCETIVRLAERIAPTGCGQARALRQRRPREPRRFAPAAGLLIALGYAQRPPPLAA